MTETTSVKKMWLAYVVALVLLYRVYLRYRPEKDVAGKTVLITGAASGLGKLFALQFAKRRANVILWDIDEKGCEQVAEECKKKRF